MKKIITEYKFRLNQDKFRNLCKLRGWEYPVKELSVRMGFSMSYISQVLSGSVYLSHEFMADYVKLTGNNIEKPAEWAGLFDIIEVIVPKSRLKDNYKKFEGQKQYTPGSVMRDMRQKDRALDLKRLDTSDPIPAAEYYDTSWPKKKSWKKFAS